MVPDTRPNNPPRLGPCAMRPRTRERCETYPSVRVRECNTHVDTCERALSLARALNIRDSQPDAQRAPSSPSHRHPRTERASHDAATRAKTIVPACVHHPSQPRGIARTWF